MNLTRNQILALIGLALGLLAGGGATMTELFGTALASKIAAAAGFLNSFINGAILILSGQSQQVKDVQAMPGVAKIVTNQDANETLTQLAEDSSNQKIVKGA